MKKYILIASIFLAACNGTSTNSSDEDSTQKVAQEKALYDSVMNIHNELMPKMGKLMGYEKQAQKQMDSIKSVLANTTFPIEVSRRIATDINTIDTLNENLKAADKAMNDWMDQFDPDPKMPTTQERAAYFADQKKKAETMKTQFLAAYQQAEQFFTTAPKQ